MVERDRATKAPGRTQTVDFVVHSHRLLSHEGPPSSYSPLEMFSFHLNWNWAKHLPEITSHTHTALPSQLSVLSFCDLFGFPWSARSSSNMFEPDDRKHPDQSEGCPLCLTHFVSSPQNVFIYFFMTWQLWHQHIKMRPVHLFKAFQVSHISPSGQKMRNKLTAGRH